MGSSRMVYYVHRPLGSSDSSSSIRKFSFQNINHQAVEIYTESTNSLTRYELMYEENKYGYKDIELYITPNVDPAEYKLGKLYFWKVDGETSYNDAKLAQIAWRLKKEHGEYNLLKNSCQKWAQLFFREVCDVRGSERMNHEAFHSDMASLSRFAIRGLHW